MQPHLVLLIQLISLQLLLQGLYRFKNRSGESDPLGDEARQRYKYLSVVGDMGKPAVFCFIFKKYLARLACKV